MVNGDGFCRIGIVLLLSHRFSSFYGVTDSVFAAQVEYYYD